MDGIQATDPTPLVEPQLHPAFAYTPPAEPVSAPVASAASLGFEPGRPVVDQPLQPVYALTDTPLPTVAPPNVTAPNVTAPGFPVSTIGVPVSTMAEQKAAIDADPFKSDARKAADAEAVAAADRQKAIAQASLRTDEYKIDADHARFELDRAEADGKGTGSKDDHFVNAGIVAVKERLSLEPYRGTPTFADLHAACEAILRHLRTFRD